MTDADLQPWVPEGADPSPFRAASRTTSHEVIYIEDEKILLNQA